MATKQTPANKPKTTAAAPKKTATPVSTADPAAQAAATKKNHKVIIILAIIAAVIFLVLPAIALTVGGVFLGKKINENGVKLNTDSKSVSITDKNGNEFSAGGSQTLPADFPTEVPLYKGELTATGKLTTDDKTNWTVTVTTGDTLKQVSDTLTSSFASNGWETSMNNTHSEGGLLLAKKNDLRVNVFYNTKDGKTTILYTVTSGANE